MLPVDTQNLFILDSVIHEHQTRHSKYLLHIPEIQTFTYGAFSASEMPFLT